MPQRGSGFRRTRSASTSRRSGSTRQSRRAGIGSRSQTLRSIPRCIRMGDTMGTVLIPLSLGLFATVDEEDATFLSQWKWHAHKSRSTYYAKCSGHSDQSGRKKLRLHRLVAVRIGLDLSKGNVVDHINGNGLDNRRCNLRVATYSQNRANSPSRRTRFPRGVRPNRDKWRAEIANGKRRKICLGTFGTQEEAARAYDAAAIERYGEFAILNFPPLPRGAGKGARK